MDIYGYKKPEDAIKYGNPFHIYYDSGLKGYYIQYCEDKCSFRISKEEYRSFHYKDLSMLFYITNKDQFLKKYKSYQSRKHFSEDIVNNIMNIEIGIVTPKVKNDRVIEVGDTLRKTLNKLYYDAAIRITFKDGDHTNTIEKPCYIYAGHFIDRLAETIIKEYRMYIHTEKPVSFTTYLGQFSNRKFSNLNDYIHSQIAQYFIKYIDELFDHKFDRSHLDMLQEQMEIFMNIENLDQLIRNVFMSKLLFDDNYLERLLKEE
ncbi:MAG: hypothetical protein PHC62_00780 [Candidatus Izemoplasmatales bacterium]|nr:hypothetical protein [Candidatus Izemoplasmatales bacterium]